MDALEQYNVNRLRLVVLALDNLVPSYEDVGDSDLDDWYARCARWLDALLPPPKEGGGGSSSIIQAASSTCCMNCGPCTHGTVTVRKPNVRRRNAANGGST
jgi:hypothetical protein